MKGLTKEGVFISFAGEQREPMGRPLRAALKARGVETWMDDELTVGSSLSEEIQEALQEYDTVVALVSEEYIAKAWPQREWNAAVSLGRDAERRLLPVLVEIKHEQAADSLPWLNNIKSVPWTDAESVADEVVRAMEKRADEKVRERERPKRRTKIGSLTGQEAYGFTKETLARAGAVFEGRIKELEEAFEGVAGEVEWEGRNAIEIRIWVNGEMDCSGGFWIGGVSGSHFGENTISYHEGGIGGRNASNGWIQLRQDEGGGQKAQWEGVMGHHDGQRGGDPKDEDDAIHQGVNLLWELLMENSRRLGREIEKRGEWSSWLPQGRNDIFA